VATATTTPISTPTDPAAIPDRKSCRTASRMGTRLAAVTSRTEASLASIACSVASHS